MAAAAAGHGFFYPSVWGSSHGSGSFGNSAVSSNGATNHSSTSVSQMPNISPTSTSNVKENRDNNSFDPPHASPPTSASSSYGYPSSPSKCDVKSIHNIKSEQNYSNRSEGGENFKTHHQRKSLASTEEADYSNRAEASPSGGFSPTNNNNHFDSDKDEVSNTHNSADGGYENTNRHSSYHYHHQDTSNNSGSSAYSGHTVSGTGNSSSGHLMKRPEGTNRTNTHEKGENRENDCASFSPTPDNDPPSLVPYNSPPITSSVGAYPYLGASHQSSPHPTSSLSSPLYGSYSTCGSLFASSKSFHHNSSSSSKSKSIKNKPNSSGKK
jgi:hypothetical protein